MCLNNSVRELSTIYSFYFIFYYTINGNSEQWVLKYHRKVTLFLELKISCIYFDCSELTASHQLFSNINKFISYQRKESISKQC